MMYSHALLPAAIAASAVAVFATLAAPSQTDPPPTPQQPGDKSHPTQRIERDGTKMIVYTHDGPASFDQYAMQAEDEINVTSVAIGNGHLGNYTSRPGAFYVVMSSAEIRLPFDGLGTFQHTFPTPIPLREGDVIGITVQGGPSSDATSTWVHLVGEAPVSASSDAMILY